MMNIEPNSKLQYKSGKQRVSVLFHNVVEGKGIYFTVRIQQASRNESGGDGYFSTSTNSVVDCHEETEMYLRKAIEVAS